MPRDLPSLPDPQTAAVPAPVKAKPRPKPSTTETKAEAFPQLRSTAASSTPAPKPSGNHPKTALLPPPSAASKLSTPVEVKKEVVEEIPPFPADANPRHSLAEEDNPDLFPMYDYVQGGIPVGEQEESGEALYAAPVKKGSREDLVAAVEEDDSEYKVPGVVSELSLLLVTLQTVIAGVLMNRRVGGHFYFSIVGYLCLKEGA